MLASRDFNAFLDLPEVAVPNAESGPLKGLSLAVKDIFDVAGLVTGCGNPLRAAEARPAGRTASAVKMREIVAASRDSVIHDQIDQMTARAARLR